MKDHKARTCAEALVKNWVLIFGAPLMLHSDQGPEFESRLFSEVLSVLAILKTRTNPYRPQSDGQVERFNRTLIEGLTTLVNSHQDNWDDFAAYVAHAYNSTMHATTGCSPNVLVFGSEIIMPADIVFGTVSRGVEVPCTITFAETLRQELRESYELVKEYCEKSAVHQKVGYDTGLKQRRYSLGQKVVRVVPPVSGAKLKANWDGPFEITRVISDVTVVIRSVRGRLYKAHVDRLRPWLALDPAEELLPLEELQLVGTQGLVARWRPVEEAPQANKPVTKEAVKRKAAPAKTKRNPQKKKKRLQPVKFKAILPTDADQPSTPVPTRRSARIAGKQGIT